MQTYMHERPAHKFRLILRHGHGSSFRILYFYKGRTIKFPGLFICDPLYVCDARYALFQLLLSHLLVEISTEKSRYPEDIL